MRRDIMKEAKIKAGSYCAYQERTQQQVRDKLYALGLYGDEVEEVLSDLISENFVNEERFAKSFARGRFKLKQWGRRKITYELKRRNISPYCLDQALDEIADEDYEIMAHELIDKKMNFISGEPYIVKNKIARYMLNKGFETELVWRILNEKL